MQSEFCSQLTSPFDLPPINFSPLHLEQCPAPLGIDFKNQHTETPLQHSAHHVPHGKGFKRIAQCATFQEALKGSKRFQEAPKGSKRFQEVPREFQVEF